MRLINIIFVVSEDICHFSLYLDHVLTSSVILLGEMSTNITIILQTFGFTIYGTVHIMRISLRQVDAIKGYFTSQSKTEAGPTLHLELMNVGSPWLWEVQLP